MIYKSSYIYQSGAIECGDCIYDGAEYIRPWGSYSMAPILRAG